VDEDKGEVPPGRANPASNPRPATAVESRQPGMERKKEREGGGGWERIYASTHSRIYTREPGAGDPNRQKGTNGVTAWNLDI